MTKTEILRKEFAAIKTVDPEGPTYARLCAFLNARSTRELTDLVQARIPWVSSLAQNRVTKRQLASSDRRHVRNN